MNKIREIREDMRYWRTHPRKGYMKGNIDLMTGLALFFVTILVVWILTVIFQSNIFTNTKFINAVNASPTAVTVFSKTSGFFTGLNTVLAFLYIFFALGAMVASAFTESNAFFSAIGIIMLPIEIVLAFGFHDAFFSLIQNSAFGALANQYPFVLTTFQYLPVVTLVVSIIILIVTFAK